MTPGLQLSAAGIEALCGYESCSLTAYRDSGGVWTIGWGHTGPDVHEGLTWTQDQADAAFVRDTAWAQAAVRNDVAVPLTQPQFDALVSLVFNIGAGAFARSTLLRKLNAGDYRGAADEFLRWNRDNGEVVTGLAVRRAKERAMFLEPEAAAAASASAPIVESHPTTEIPPMADTVQSVATVAGLATGNPWIGPALQVLRGLWPELKPLLAGSGSEVAQRNAKAAEAVIGAVMQATGTDSPPDAVKAVQNDPVMAQQARAAAADTLDQFGLVEVAGGVAAARQFSIASGVPPFWQTGAFWITLMFMPLIYFAAFQVLRVDSIFGADTRATVLGAIFIGMVQVISSFWMGTSFKNSVKQPEQ